MTEKLMSGRERGMVEMLSFVFCEHDKVNELFQAIGNENWDDVERLTEGLPKVYRNAFSSFVVEYIETMNE